MTKTTIKIWKSIRPLRGKEDGSAMVELAVSFSLLSVILLGVVEFGRVIYTAIEVTNAAHAAAQYASTSHSAATDWSVSGSTYSGGIVNAAAADAANMSGLTVTNIGISCKCANSSYVPSSCSDNTTCSSHYTQMVETVTVQTQASYKPIFQFPRSGSFTLTGNASQVVSNQ